MRVSNMKSLRDLKLIGLDAERSHAIAGGRVRIFFRLSETPPLGWSYVFMTTWKALDPSKRPTGVDGDAICIDCIPEEMGPHYLERLEKAVEESNKTYRETALQQAIHTSHKIEADAQLRAKLQQLSQTLYPPTKPVVSATPRFLGSELLGRLWHFFMPTKRQKRAS